MKFLFFSLHLTASERQRWALFSRRHYIMGNWMCRAKFTWRLYANIEICALDFGECYVRCFKQDEEEKQQMK